MSQSSGPDGGGVLVPIVYFAQCFFYGYGGYCVFLKLRAWRYRDPKNDTLAPGELEAEDAEKKKKKKKA